MDNFKVSRRFQVIGNVTDILSEHTSPEKAVEFRELCCLACVTESEAQNAIKYLLSKGMRIRLTDGLPHKLYWECDQ